MGLTREFEKTLREKFVRDLNPNSSKSILVERILVPLLTKISGVEEYEEICNEKFAGLSVAKPEDLEEIISRLGFKVRIHSNSRLNLKSQYIVVSNHPTGPNDGIFMQKIFNHLGLRGKTMGDDIMCGLEQMREAYIGLSHRVEGKSRIAQLRVVKKNLQEGLSLGLFPSGHVSYFNFKEMKISDFQWNSGFVEMAKSNNINILPVYIEAHLSIFYYIFKFIYPNFSSLRLFREAIKFVNINKGKYVNIYIGNPIEIQALKSTEEDAKKIQNICENLKYQTYTCIE